MKNTTLVLLALAMVGCGGGGGGGGAAGAPPAPVVPGVVLTSLALNATAVTLEMGGVFVLAATGHYSDGSSKPEPVAWTLTQSPAWTEFTPDPDVATISTGYGTTTLVTALTEGSATIQATVGILNATATITVSWDVPAAPKPFYGCASNGQLWLNQLWRYSGVPGEAPTVLVTDPVLAAPSGVTDNREGTEIYVLVGTDVHRYRISDGDFSIIGTIPTVGYGLDRLPDGRLATNDGTNVVAFNPADGTTATVSVGSGIWLQFTSGPDGATYTYDIMGGGVYRRTAAAGEVLYAQGMAINGNGGMCFNAKNELFYAALFDSDITKFVDLNGDGDAADAGESSQFAASPFTSLFSGSYSMIQGLTAGGGGSILVNVVGLDMNPDLGVYWVRDLDGSGTATDDAGAVIQLNTEWLDTYDGNMFVQTRR